MKEIKKFSTDLETGKYLFFGHEVDVISVYHKPYTEDTGKHTWIKCSFVDKTGNNAKVDTTSDIIKKMLGIPTNEYDTTNSKKTTKVLNDSELSDRINTVSDKYTKSLISYVNSAEGSFAIDKLAELKNNVLFSVRELCRYIETAANKERKETAAKAAADRAVKAVGNNKSVSDIELMIAELERQKAILEASKELENE